MKTLFYPDLEKLFRIVGLYLIQSGESLERVLAATDNDIRKGIGQVEDTISTYAQRMSGSNISERNMRMGKLWALLQDDGRVGYAQTLITIRKVFADLSAHDVHPRFLKAQLSEVGFEELMIIPVAIGFYTAVTSSEGSKTSERL